MTSLFVALGFVFMVIAPCMVAMKVGLHEGADDARFDDPEEQSDLAALRSRVPD